MENWERDLSDILLRDRNHPSVVLWSIGNEIPNWSIADASRIGKMLTAKVRELDPTRPVTQGVTSAYIHLEWDNSEKTFEHLDVAGYNYLTHFLETDHAKHPERVIVGTESYPNQAYVYWKDVEEKPYVIGDFMDYKAIFDQFYADGGTDWVLEMEDPMTRQQMFDKAAGHNAMSQTREMPRLGGARPPQAAGAGVARSAGAAQVSGAPQSAGAAQTAGIPQPSADVRAARPARQNASRLKALKDIETNMRTLEGFPFIR